MTSFKVGRLYKRVTKWQHYMVEDPDEPDIAVITNVVKQKKDGLFLIEYYLLSDPDDMRASYETQERDRWKLIE